MDKVEVAKIALEFVAGVGTDVVVAGVFGTFGAGATALRKLCVPVGRIVTSYAIQKKVIQPQVDELVDDVVAIANGEVDFKTLFL